MRQHVDHDWPFIGLLILYALVMLAIVLVFIVAVFG